MVVRPLTRRILGKDGVKRSTLSTGLAPVGGPEAAMVAVPQRDSQTARMIEIAKVNGQVQQESLERIGQLVQGNPSESVAVLRQWLHERN
jgi:flagellar M-ring protein FliF